MPTLEVHQLCSDEVYRDIIRVNEAHRVDKRQKRIREGQVCLVRVNGRKCFAVLRGYQDCNAPQIRMDDYTRGPFRLNVTEGQTYEFEFRNVGFIGRLRWAWNSSEIGYQVASQLAVVSLALGVVALLLAVNWHWLWSLIHFSFCHQ